MVQTVCGEIGLGVPTSVLSNADQNIIQMGYLANRAGAELAQTSESAGYFQKLRKQYTFTTQGYGPYTCTITAGSNQLTNLSSTVGIALGQQVYASGLVNDTIVTDITNIGLGQVGISQAPTSTVTLTGQSVTFAVEQYAFPSDFAYLINQTEWDRNFRWQLLGPIDAQEWQVIKSGISPVGPRMRFRIFNGAFNINPVGSASTIYTDTIVFEYITKWWVATQSAPTTPAQTAYLQDTDVGLIDEDLITLDVKWRFLRSKGLSYDEEYEAWDRKYARTIGRDAAARNLPLNARASGVRLLSSQNVPDTGYGS